MQANLLGREWGTTSDIHSVGQRKLEVQSLAVWPYDQGSLGWKKAVITKNEEG